MKNLATPKPSAQSLNVKHKKSLIFDANVFIPRSACAGAVKTVMPTPAPSSTLHLAPTPADSPAVSVPMKLPKLVMEKFDGDPLDWPE